MFVDTRLPFQRRHLPDDLGPRLREARAGLGRSRRDVADAAGVAPRTLARIERGAQSPTWSTLEGLCVELGVSLVAIARRWVVDSFDVPDNLVAAPGIGLRALRRERGLSMATVAAAAGVSVATLSRFERGLTASRLLGVRPGGPDVAFHDRAVELDAERLAPALGCADAAELERACRSAWVATGRRPA